MKRLFKACLEKVFGYVYLREPKNILHGLQRRALDETLDFFERNLSQVALFRNKFDLLEAALAQVNGNTGLFCEFGAYRVETINFYWAFYGGAVVV